MKLTFSAKRKLRAALIHVLSTEGKTDRATLIRKAIALCKLTPEEQRDHSVGSKLNAMRAFAGIALDAFVSLGSASVKDGIYALEKEETVLIREEQCEAQILRIVKEGNLTQKDVFDRLDQHFNTEKTPSGKDDQLLYTMVTAILDRLTKAGQILFRDGRYRAAVAVSDAPLADESAFKAQFLARLHSLGGEFFEHFTMALFDKYYRKRGYTVTRCEVSGGSSDGGVDGLADTIDPLGFRENIMVQTKCRSRIYVTETEVRAFYGAVCALGGSRGVFVTSGTFHRGAQKLLDSIENCVGVDGDKLFEMALFASHGIRKTHAGYRFDETAFV